MRRETRPARLLAENAHLFVGNPVKGPVLDLACGDGRNGIHLALRGVEVVLCDVSEDALFEARRSAARQGASVTTVRADLERDDHPLPVNRFAGAMVFRFLHRPLFARLKRAIKPGGIVMYETFTEEQPRYGKPTNPDYLLQKGELAAVFADWTILSEFEGVLPGPDRAVARIISRKPAAGGE